LSGSQIKPPALPEVHDYEVANVLNTKPKYIGRLIRDFGIEDRRSIFVRRFETTYGANAIWKFKRIIDNPEYCLSDVSRYFGFSREYARQVYEKIYGYPYTLALHKRRLEKQHEDILVKIKQYRDSKITKYLEELRDKLLLLGIIPRISRERGIIRIFLNGHKIAFRYSEKPAKTGNKMYFRISYREGFCSDCDFVICLCKDMNECVYYVIPNSSMPKTGIAFSVDPALTGSKYSQFIEAWHLISK
jgi:hypothetical protein